MAHIPMRRSPWPDRTWSARFPRYGPSHPPQRRRRAHGQALVEFSLLASILLALILSVFAIWPVLNAHDAIALAAASGAHEAAISGGDVARTEALVAAALQAADYDPAAVQVSVSCAEACGRYDPITVRVAVTVAPGVPLPWFDPSYTVAAESTRASEIDGAGLSGEAPPLWTPIELPKGGTP